MDEAVVLLNIQPRGINGTALHFDLAHQLMARAVPGLQVHTTSALATCHLSWLLLA